MSDPELEEEIGFHLEMRARELVEEGWSPEEARAEALRRFGDPGRVRSLCRGFRERERRQRRRTMHLEDFRSDVAYGARQLLSRPGFAAVAILTLAVGIGATASIFGVVRAVVLRPLGFEEPERIALVGEDWEGLGPTAASVGNFVDWRRAVEGEVFTHLAALDYENFNLSDKGDPERVLGGRVSRGFFELLGTPALVGRWFAPEEDRPGSERVTILSHRLWARRFGSDPAVLGKSVRLNGSPHAIVGVMPPDFSYPADDQELWTPASFTPDEEAMHDEHYLSVFGRLAPGVSYESAQARMESVNAELEKLYPKDTNGVRVVSYASWLTGDYRERLYVMMGAVALVLLIACGNVANLLLARATARAREMALRAALGAGAGRLARQVLVETLVVSLLAAAVGVALAYWMTESFLAKAPGRIPRLEETGIDPVVLGFTLLAAIASTLAAGVAPALAAARTEMRALRAEPRAGGGRSQGRIRSALVAAEAALALTLLVGAGLLVRSALEMQGVAPGFEPRGVLTARVTLPREAYPDRERVVDAFERIVEETGRLPGVAVAAVSSQVPMGPGGGTNGLVPEGRTAEEPIHSRLRMVSPEYFAAMGIPLLEGRLIEASDRREGALVMVVSATLAHTAWPGESALSKRILCCEGGDADPKWKTVVGVVGDVHSRGVGAPIEPEFYLPIDQAPPAAWDWVQRTLTVAVRTGGDPDSVAPALRAAVSAVDPALPLYGVASMEERIHDSLGQPRFLASLLLVTSLVGLGLAAVGIYGVMGYLVVSRTHEIGVRLALGARPGDVVAMVVRQAMAPVAVGMTLGLVLSVALGGFLESQLFGITPTDPWTFASVASLLAVVGLGASYLPARRIARLDPRLALYQP
jgi:putative ABC transport system permease protein